MTGDCTGTGGADEGTVRLEVLLQVDEVWELFAEDWRGAKAGRGGAGRGAVDMMGWWDGGTVERGTVYCRDV